MIDIKLIRENPEMVRQNMRNKFQDNKVELVDKVLALDSENRTIKTEVEALRAERNKSSKLIGGLMAQGKKDEAEAMKIKTSELGGKIDELSARENEVEEEIKTIMMRIPNIIDKSVRSARTTAKMSNVNASATLWSPILRFRITPTLWNDSMA